MDKKRKFKLKAGLILIIILGAVLRFTGLNWDEGQHLHPDERYISLVLTAIRPVLSFEEYFLPASSLSPFNTQYPAYIYGQLPLTVIKYLSVWLDMDAYEKTYLMGRSVSAIFDTASILLVFILGRKLFHIQVGVLGALVYSLMPSAIQNAHFMTMESWSTFFWLLTLVILVSGRNKLPSFSRQIAVGVVLGASLAVKATSVFLVAAAGTLGGILSMPAAILAFRIFQPTIFSSASWFDWRLVPQFRQAFELQQLAINGKVMFPPQWQWVGTAPIWFTVKNLLWWGIGPAVSLLLILGLVRTAVEFGRHRQWKALALVFFILAVVGYSGIKFVKTVRYTVPVLGLAAVFAGAGADWLREKFGRLGKPATAALLFLASIWALMFTSIYRRPQTRISASRWIYQNIPSGSTIAIEEWDDPLPLYLPDGFDPGSYRTFQMAVYAPDNQDKQRKIEGWINKADWVVLSSYRAKGSIGKLPEQFPLMSRFYRDLEDGSLGFMKAAEFISYPSLTIYDLRLTINDSSAEESFWVYDHPKVEIYKKI